MKPLNSPAYRRVFGLKETVTITVGTVIGVGLFTVGASVVGTLGGAVILATVIAMLISIYPAMIYAEMSAALPLSGGTYQYAKYGIGKPLGMLAGWNFIISMISVASGEALAFSFYIRTFFEAFGMSLPFSDAILACAAVVVFLLLGIFGVEMTGKMQNAFLFFFWGVAIVWVFSMIPHLEFGNFTGGAFSAITPGNFFAGVAMIWWCFAGFETCCSLGEEIKHPQINLPRALFLAPFIVFAVNGLFQWVLACIVPPEGLAAIAAAAAPYADGMKAAGIVGFPLILLCLGIAFGGDFSTLNASIVAPSRYLQAMARDGSIPKFFAYIHPKFHTPIFAVILPAAITILLVLTNSVSFIASLSLFATLLYYVIGMISACGLRKKYPHLERPFKVRGLWIGVPVSVLIYLLLMTQLDVKAVALGAAWSVLGLAIFYLCQYIDKRRAKLAPTEPALAAKPMPMLDPDPVALPNEKKSDLSRQERARQRSIARKERILSVRNSYELEILEIQKELPALPAEEEKKKMDKKFLFWKIVVFSACGIILALNVISFFL